MSDSFKTGKITKLTLSCQIVYFPAASAWHDHKNNLWKESIEFTFGDSSCSLVMILNGGDSGISGNYW